MGELSRYRNTLERAPLEPKQAEKINVRKQELQGKSTGELGDIYCLYRYKKARLQQRIKEYNVELEAVIAILTKRMEVEGVDKYKLASGTSLSFKDDVYVSVKDKAKWDLYIADNELEHMLTMHASTMKSMVVDMLTRGEMPAESSGLKVFFKPGLRPWGLPKHLDVEDEPEPNPDEEQTE